MSGENYETPTRQKLLKEKLKNIIAFLRKEYRLE